MTNSNQTDQEDTVKSSGDKSKSSETGGGIRKAGEFSGDLRDLPNTPPPDQERPRREDPPDQPKPAPTPEEKPTDN